MACKFCQSMNGSVGRTGKLVHINRDGLCGPCATLLDKVKYQPEKVSVDDKEWFDRKCLLNHKLGLFVPVAQRRVLRLTHPPKWHCKKCGTGHVTDQDFNYKNYCVSCADAIRRNRIMPPKTNRKRRSDFEGQHFRPKGGGIMTKQDKRVGKRERT